MSMSQWQELQCDLNKLTSWTETWQMKFNVEKCQAQHIGNNNVQARHVMNTVPLSCAEKNGSWCCGMKSSKAESTLHRNSKDGKLISRVHWKNL